MICSSGHASNFSMDICDFSFGFLWFTGINETAVILQPVQMGN